MNLLSFELVNFNAPSAVIIILYLLKIMYFILVYIISLKLLMISLCILMCYLIPVSFQEHVPCLFIRYYTNTRRDRHPQRIGYMLQGSKLVTLCDLRSCIRFIRHVMIVNQYRHRLTRFLQVLYTPLVLCNEWKQWIQHVRDKIWLKHGILLKVLLYINYDLFRGRTSYALTKRLTCSLL